jgi:uncharacterized protein (TIGR00251 family)
VAKLSIKVVPGASKTELAGWLDDTLKVRLAAPPEQGKANRALVRLLSETLGVPARSIRIVSGTASPRKLVEIDSLPLETVRGRLSSPD